MDYFTKTQACRLLGITMPTLNLCLKKLREQGHDLTPVRDPYNPHLVLLSADHIETVRQFRGAYLARLPLKAIASPSKLPQLPAPPRAASDLPHSASQGTTTIPEGWVSYKQMCLTHGVSERLADKQINRSFTMHTETVYQVRGVDVKRVLDPEQQAAFLEWLASRQH
jgi:hypothetical protein